MPNSGPAIHQQLMDAYADSQARLQQHRGRVDTEAEERAALREDRSEVLRTLAEHYLPELTSEAVDNTWKEIRKRLTGILEKKQDHELDLSGALQGIIAQRQQQENELLQLSDQLDQLVDQRESLVETIEQKLREDEQFIHLSDRAALAEAALERAEANLAEIDQDAARKLPAYDNSTLFRYLYDRGYGTGAYGKRGLTRRMDRWLAKYIQYHQARQGYEFLKKTPEQMRKIIAEDRLALDTVMEELERQRDLVAADLGLPDLLQRVRAAKESRDQCLDLLAGVRTEHEKFERQLSDLEDPHGSYYREAIAVFREMLESAETRDLKRRAKSTAEITDDQIVARLAGVDTEVKDLDRGAKQRRMEIAREQAFMDRLGRLIQRFRAARFDSARSEFSDRLNIPEEIDRARDADDIELLWNRIRRAQSWGPTTMERVGGVMNHPMTQVLVTTMAHVAANALRGHARRAAERHAEQDRSRRKSQRKKKNDWSDWGGDSSDGGFGNRSWF